MEYNLPVLTHEQRFVMNFKVTSSKQSGYINLPVANTFLSFCSQI